MSIQYKVNAPISTEQFVSLLTKSNLAERRPVDDLSCMQGMISNSNLTLSAWHESECGDVPELVGLARCMTDFHYACYLSDLAVSKPFQKRGIGKQLQILTQKQLGSRCKLILIAAPSANAYYRQIGFTQNSRCWVLEPHSQIH